METEKKLILVLRILKAVIEVLEIELRERINKNENKLEDDSQGYNYSY